MVRAVRTEGEGGEGVDVIVVDTGSGFDADILPCIFEPFFTAKADGTGLGLTNARKIAEEHNCRISAANRSTVGARFTFHVPPERLIDKDGYNPDGTRGDRR